MAGAPGGFADGGKEVADQFVYSSDSNDRWLSVEELGSCPPWMIRAYRRHDRPPSSPMALLGWTMMTFKPSLMSSWDRSPPVHMLMLSNDRRQMRAQQHATAAVRHRCSACRMWQDLKPRRNHHSPPTFAASQCRTPCRCFGKVCDVAPTTATRSRRGEQAIGPKTKLVVLVDSAVTRSYDALRQITDAHNLTLWPMLTPRRQLSRARCRHIADLTTISLYPISP